MDILLEVVSKSEFDSLKENMQMYQNNIDNNITWFYEALAIMLSVLIVSLIIVVKNSISVGIEKGIKKSIGKIEEVIKENKDFSSASGTCSVSVEHGNLVQAYGFNNLSLYNFVNLAIIDKNGKVCEYHSLEIHNHKGSRGFNVKIIDYNQQRDGFELFFNIVWRNDSSYENIFRNKK